MKKLISFVSAGALLALGHVSNAVELSVTVTNIKPGEGSLYLRIYSPQNKWLASEKDGPQLTDVIVLASDDDATEITKTFDLPEGQYAVTVTQDINSNGVMDRNWMGMPTEPTGSTGEDSKKDGPPTFEECVFDLKEKSQQTVKLIQR